MDIAVIDISGFDGGGRGARDRIVKAWGEAFRTLGFAQIVGHGVDETLIDELDATARAFFALPLEAKLRCGGSKGGIGYMAPGKVALGLQAGAKPDLVESMMINDILWDPTGRAAQFTADGSQVDIWPAELPQLRDVVERYARATCAVAQRLMRISALALDLPEDYFAPYFSRMPHALRLAHYPAQPEAPLPGQLRSGPHTDFSGFTLLRQEDAPGGLQVAAPDGGWIDVPAVPGAFVINAGDLIQRWTNDRWRSNLHRVINPGREAFGADRLSIVMFTGPNRDAQVACLPGCEEPGQAPRYAPIIAAEHSAMKHREAFARAGA
jgi:isopenicillin N synthase-like dioxygenase